MAVSALNEMKSAEWVDEDGRCQRATSNLPTRGGVGQQSIVVFDAATRLNNPWIDM